MSKFQIEMDTFSHGQVGSKLWACRELENQTIFLQGQGLLPPNPNVWILAGWYGSMGFMLASRENVPWGHIYSFDQNPETLEIAEKINNFWHCESWKFRAFHKDINELDFFDNNLGPVPDVVINTSCEHIVEKSWWNGIPKETLVVLQSTDMEHEQHINRVRNLEQFIASYGEVSEILFSDELKFEYPDFSFKRFMLIARK